MAYTDKALRKHPGLNPEYFAQMKQRRIVQKSNENRKANGLPVVPVPKQPNRWVPHYGAKEAAEYAARHEKGLAQG